MWSSGRYAPATAADVRKRRRPGPGQVATADRQGAAASGRASSPPLDVAGGAVTACPDPSGAAPLVVVRCVTPAAPATARPAAAVAARRAETCAAKRPAAAPGAATVRSTEAGLRARRLPVARPADPQLPAAAEPPCATGRDVAAGPPAAESDLPGPPTRALPRCGRSHHRASVPPPRRPWRPSRQPPRRSRSARPRRPPPQPLSQRPTTRRTTPPWAASPCADRPSAAACAAPAWSSPLRATPKGGAFCFVKRAFSRRPAGRPLTYSGLA